MKSLSSMRRSLKKIAIEQDRVIIRDNRRDRIAEVMIRNRGAAVSSR